MGRCVQVLFDLASAVDREGYSQVLVGISCTTRFNEVPPFIANWPEAKTAGAVEIGRAHV